MTIKKNQITLHNIKRAIKAYVRIIREKLVTLFPWLEWYFMTRHVKEQVVFRLHLMSLHPEGKKCLESGECLCGCPVPELQYADDACEGGCYDSMMSKEAWSEFKKLNDIKIDIKNQTVC